MQKRNVIGYNCHDSFVLKRTVFGLLITGVVLTKSQTKECDPVAAGEGDGCVTKSRCSYSEEANRVDLEKFLLKVQEKYYDLHPEELIFKPGGITPEKLKEKFKPYNPDPNNLRRISDSAKELLNELNTLNVNTRLLRPRDKKAIAQVKHYLKSNFGTPFDRNYYAGLFLMGPNLFCWQPICRVRIDIRYGLGNLRIKDLNDVRLVLDKMKLVAQTFSQYINNMRYGIEAGMVRSTEECIAGIDAFKQNYFQVYLKGERGMCGLIFNLVYEKSL